eukprot:SAG31_NODE_25996_length_450_cov_1.094017_1_plen_108_part_10
MLMLCGSLNILLFVHFVCPLFLPGLGFVVFHNVLDKISLRKIFVAVVAFLSTAVPFLIALVPKEKRRGGVMGCELHLEQKALLRDLIVQFNDTCAWESSNETIADLFA